VTAAAQDGEQPAVLGRLGYPVAGEHTAAEKGSGHSLADLVVQPPAQLGALAEQAVGVWVVALVYGEPGGTVQGPDSHRGLVGYQAQQLAQPLPPFGEMTMKGPEQPHDRRQAQRGGRVLLAVPVDRRADVVVLDVEPFQPVFLAQPGQRAPGFPGQGQESSRVRPAQASGFRCTRQTFSRELADRLQHQVTRRPRRTDRAQQALIHQLLQAIQHRHAGTGLRPDRLDDLQGHAAPEHRARRQQPPGLISEQVIAPFDGGTQGLLTIWQITAPADQQTQRMLQPPEDRLRWQQPDPRRALQAVMARARPGRRRRRSLLPPA